MQRPEVSCAYDIYMQLGAKGLSYPGSRLLQGLILVPYSVGTAQSVIVSGLTFGQPKYQNSIPSKGSVQTGSAMT